MYMHDIAFSFAGENRVFVEKIRNKIVENGFDVFYDDDYIVELWGTDLTESFPDHYINSRYVVLFIDEYYLKKMWTYFERQIVIEKFISLKGKEYLLPVYLNGFMGKLPGLPSIIGFINCSTENPDYLISLIMQKLKHLRQDR